jgi:phospholipase/carboxylesterase
MNIETVEVGGLSCCVVDALPAGVAPQMVVVLCHGFGASGTDLVPFGPELIESSPTLAERVQFVFPAAPLDLAEFGMPGGRAWWLLDMAKLQRAMTTGEFRDLRAEHPEGLDFARERLLAVIAEWSERTGVPLSRFVLGGFSQGSMLATETTLHLNENPAGLIVLSGTLLNEAVWRERVSLRAGLTVLQSHGQSDPILPFIAAEWLRDMLTDAGASVEFLPFRGGHAIPMPVIERVLALLERLATAK